MKALLLIVLSILQLSLGVVMITQDGHANLCAFDEHCVLQSIVGRTEAVPPLSPFIPSVIFVLTFLTILRVKEIRVYSSPPSFKFLETLKGVVQRE